MQNADFTHQRVDASTSSSVTLRHSNQRSRWHPAAISFQFLSSPNRAVRSLLVGIFLLLGLLVTSWLLSAGIPSLFISPYPKIFLIVPANYQSQPTSQAAAVFLHQRTHRSKSWFISSQTPLPPLAGDSVAKNGELSQQVGVIINDVLPLVDNQVQEQFRWQLIKTTLSLWKNPTEFWEVATLALLSPEPQSEEVTAFVQWGESVARELQPLETASTNCSLGVSNATGQLGLGKAMADFLANQGAVIRRITDSEDRLFATQILLDQEYLTECQVLQEELLHVLPANIPVTQQSGIFEQYRVPLLVLIGSDSAQLFTPLGQ